MHYIKDVFENKKTEHSHSKFIRYSKGEFVGPKIGIKITKSSIKLKTSFHVASEVLEILADLIGNEEVFIKGTLSWNFDLGPDLEKLGIKYLKLTKSRGIFNYVLENKVLLKDFVNVLGKYHLLVSFVFEDLKLSTKKKYPKPNKEVTSDFCKVTLPISMKKKILSEFAFDVDLDCKDIEISHKIFVKDIILPKIDDFEKARKLATRKGNLIREVVLDKDNQKQSEIEFNV